MAATPATPATPAGDLKSRLAAAIKAHEEYVADVPSMKEFEDLLDSRRHLVAIINRYGALLKETDVELTKLADDLYIDLEAQYGITPRDTVEETPQATKKGASKAPRSVGLSILDRFDHTRTH